MTPVLDDPAPLDSFPNPAFSAVPDVMCPRCGGQSGGDRHVGETSLRPVTDLQLTIAFNDCN